jgi:sugar (pentulose or hexulose) kinase
MKEKGDEYAHPGWHHLSQSGGLIALAPARTEGDRFGGARAPESRAGRIDDPHGSAGAVHRKVHMKTRIMAAVDLGAGSGRVMLASFDGHHLSLEEVHRFPNSPVRLGGHRFWNILGLWNEILAGLRKARQVAGTLDSIGVDTWGIDYGLVDAGGFLLSQPLLEHSQSPLQAPAAFARCIMESLVLRYRQVFHHIGQLTGSSVKSVYVLGGGARNVRLNQWLADALDRPVIAGPYEATTRGNALMQLVGLGELHTLEEVRAIARTTPTQVFSPQTTHFTIWNEAAQRFSVMASIPIH